MANLGDIADFKNGKALPKERYLASGQWPVYGSNGEIARTDDILNADKVISIGRVGAYCGAVYAIRTKSWVTDNAIIAEPKEGNDFDFLYYLLSSLQLNRTAIGSAQPLLTQGGLKVISLPEIPKYEQQKIIGKSLKALDDKIELNNQINETLETMAKATFKEWFIDFVPVKAKAEGKKPFGMDDETAALFPDSFEDSPLGPIPKGWRISTIAELTEKIQYGYTASASENIIGPKFLRITDIQGGHCNWDIVPYCSAKELDIQKYSLKDGDVVVARTGASTGENMLILDPPPQALFASYLVCFKFEEAAMSRFVSSFMRTKNYFDFISNILGGSAQPNANAQQLASAKLAVPSRELLNLFFKQIQPFEKLLRHNQEESNNLYKTRDLLLPKLISGELELSEVSSD